MTPVIHVEHLCHQYAERKAVDDLSFEVEKGEVVGLLGPNGAGKTTTVRLLNGLFKPVSGKIDVLGLDPIIHGHEVRRQTGVLTETPALYERLTAVQNLNFFGTLAEMPDGNLKKRIDELLVFFDLVERAGDRVSTYSKGMKQRLALARALLNRPPLLFLDEPTSGLDPEASRQVHDLIEAIRGENGQSVLLCTHNLFEAERLCDRLAVINHGRLLAFGTMDELRRLVSPGLWLKIDFWQPVQAQVFEKLSVVEGVIDIPNRDDAGSSLKIQVKDEAAIPQIVKWLVYQGTQVLSVQPHKITLEEVYFKLQNEDQEGEVK